MKVLTTQPTQFITGDVLDPEDINSTFNYAQDVLIDVQSKRYQYSTLTLQFVETVGTPYTNASALEERTYRFRVEKPIVIERGYFSANMTSAAAVNVELVNLFSLPPPGGTAPYMTTGGAVASAATVVSDINTEKIRLGTSTEYLIRVVSSGIFTLNRFDVVLHLKSDRWIAASNFLQQGSFIPAQFNDASSTGAAAINNTAANLTTAVASFAANKLTHSPAFVVRHNFNNATAATRLTFIVPRENSGKTQGIVVNMYAVAFFDAAVTTTVTFTLRDQAAVPITTLTLTFVAQTTQSGISAITTTALTLAQANAVADIAQDYTLLIASGSATICRKAYCYIWISR